MNRKRRTKSDEVNLILAALEELVNRELSRSDELYGEDKQEELGEYLSAIRLCQEMRRNSKRYNIVRHEEDQTTWLTADDVDS